MRNRVVCVGNTFNRCYVHAIGDRNSGKRTVGVYRLADDHVTPGSRESIWPNADFDAMKVHRTIVATLHVIFARPDELDGSSAQAFRDHRCFALHMRITYGTSAETATSHLGMKSYLIRF